MALWGTVTALWGRMAALWGAVTFGGDAGASPGGVT